METIKLHQSINSQTVHLPEAFCLPGNEVHIYREGSKVVLQPLISSWDELLRALDTQSGEGPCTQKR